MRVAISVSHDDLISPLFDASKQVWVADIDSGSYGNVRSIEFDGLDGDKKIKLLAQEGIELLVCGAISRCLEAYASSYGIKVDAFVTGRRTDILAELGSNGSISPERKMPGCPRRLGMREGCGGRRKRGYCFGRGNQ